VINIRQPELLDEKKFIDRFWGRVNKNTGTDCWEWTGKVDKDGLGKYHIGLMRLNAHRYAYYLTHKDLPTRSRHKCGNRLCVNPEHIATDYAEIAFYKRKEHGSKLDEATVKQIRAEGALGKQGRMGSGNLGVMAKKYGVSISTIHAILKYDTWKKTS